MQDQEHSLKTLDITSIVKPFFWVKIANLWMLILGINIPVVLVVNLLEGTLTAEMLYLVPLMLVVAFASIIAWKNLNVLNSVTQAATMTSILLVIGMFTVMLVLAIVYREKIPEANYEAILWSSVIVVPLIPAALSIIWLRRRRIEEIGVDLPKLIRPQASEFSAVPRARPRNPARGWALIGAGYAYLVGFDLLWISFPHENQSGHGIYVLGYLFFLYARAQFQPTAEAVLEADKRPPILFLRSFQDDAKINYSSTTNVAFDYSLESRISEHFFKFGPFIAVDAPKRKVLALGAARAKLGDGDWKMQVTNWMDASCLIVVLLGVTHWVEWELRQILERGHVHKLILCFPQVTTNMFSRDKRLRTRKGDASARLDTLKATFANSPWAAALSAIPKPQHIRSLVFERDGSVIVVTARSRTRNAYHLAILIGHFLLTTGASSSGARAARPWRHGTTPGD